MKLHEDGVHYVDDDWCYEDSDFDDAPDPGDHPDYDGTTNLE